MTHLMSGRWGFTASAIFLTLLTLLIGGGHYLIWNTLALVILAARLLSPQPAIAFAVILGIIACLAMHLFTLSDFTSIGMIFGIVAATVSTLAQQADRADEAMRASRTDPLTGLPNRLALFERLQRDFHSNTSIRVFFVDLNGFKSINDRYGHHVGDRVLRTQATRMQRVLQRDDMVARVGGDEFVIVSPITATTSAETLVRDLHEASGRVIDINGYRVHATITIGYAESSEANGVDELLELADGRMYKQRHTVRQRGRTVRSIRSYRLIACAATP